MTRDKTYPGLSVNSECVRQLRTAFERVFSGLPPAYVRANPVLLCRRPSVARGNEEWTFDNFDELALELDTPYVSAHCMFEADSTKQYIWMDMNSYSTMTSLTRIKIYSDSRDKLTLLASLVDQVMQRCGVQIQTDLVPAIFIGHGQSPMWRDLKDHLTDKHGYKVEAFESEPRAGYGVSEVLERMSQTPSVAILVMAAEDKMADGLYRARQNVIHEIGLFQGRLGLSRTIVLKESGTEDFSNIEGLQQIRFSAGNIKETFGEVVATIARETNRGVDSVR